MVGVCVVLFFSSFLDMRCFFFLFCLRSTVAERMGSLLCVCVCVCVCVFCQKGAHRSLKRKGRKPLKKKKEENQKNSTSLSLCFFFFSDLPKRIFCRVRRFAAFFFFLQLYISVRRERGLKRQSFFFFFMAMRRLRFKST